MILLVTVTHPGSCTVGSLSSRIRRCELDYFWQTEHQGELRQGSSGNSEHGKHGRWGFEFDKHGRSTCGANAQSEHTLAITLNTLDAEPPKCLITASSSMQGSHVIAFVMHLCYTPPTIPNLTFEQRCKCMPMARWLQSDKCTLHCCSVMSSAEE